MKEPPHPKNVGKRRIITAIDGSKVALVVRDEIVVPQGEGKLIYFQKLQFESDGRFEYRFTYYMRGFKPSRLGRWVFGQYSLMAPEHEVAIMLKEARARGWPGI
jgi:hypothetical protein